MVPDPDHGGTGPLRRIGVFGGTFDPPHVGHVTVARDVADALGLDRVLWIPAAVPPHKQGIGISPDPLRLEMVTAACASDPRFEACDVELERGGVSYTVDTLRTLAGRWPDARLHLIMGVDQFRTMETEWREPEEVLRLAVPVIMDRDGASAREGVPAVAGADGAVFVPVTRIDVSATAVREMVGRGGDAAGLVPDAVMRVIEREHLYEG